MEGSGAAGAQAPEIASRLLANVETVVRGKTEEIRLVLTALVCGGHVLLEDVPGTAKTVLARAIAGSVDGARVLAHPVHARPAADGRHRALGLQPARSRLRVPARTGVRERPPRRRDQPRDAEDAVGAARGDGGAAGHDRRRHARAARAVPRPRDREPDRAGGHVPASRGAARPLLPAHRARLPVRGRRGGDRRAAAERAPASQPACGALARRGAVAARRGGGRLHRPGHPALGHPARARDASGGGRRDRRIRAREPGARAGDAGVGAPLRPRLRDAGRRRGSLPVGRHAPHRLHAELRGCCARDRLGGCRRPLPGALPRDRAAAGSRARSRGRPAAADPSLAVAQ